MKKPEIGDRVSWIDSESKMRKTGVIEDIDDIVSLSNKFDLEDPYAKIEFKDLQEKSYQIRCDQNKKMYSFLEREWDGKVIKPN